MGIYSVVEGGVAVLCGQGRWGCSRPSLWLPKPPLTKESNLAKAAESAEAGDAEKVGRIWATENHCVRERPRMTAQN